ncbi:MAG TPA: hypothetical protein PLL66_04525 [Bacteroidales bacterium]|nr:hypothetical protein [Bacteroidales bacterium]
MRRLYFIILNFLIFALSGIDFLYCQADQYSVLRAEELNVPVKYNSTGNVEYDIKTWKRELINYFRENYNFPTFVNIGSKDIVIMEFNEAVAEWYVEYPEYEEILDLPPEFKYFYKYDVSCYVSAPVYIEGSDEEQNRVYDISFKNIIYQSVS